MMGIIQKIKTFIAFDFHLSSSTVPALVVLILLYPAVLLLPEKCGYENELIENTQLMIIFFSCFIWCIVPEKRNLFIFAALIMFTLALREVNTGRTLFYAVPGEVNAFYGWDKVWYAPYRLPAGIIYGIGCAVFFFAGKVYKELGDLLAATRIPVWNVVLFLILTVASDLLDKFCRSLILEEGVELAAYVVLFMTLCLYAFNPIRRVKK